MVNRITYEPIIELYPHEMAVCGSNTAGVAIGELAKYCYDDFGAKYGVGFGPTGQCYMVPTKDASLKVLPLKDIAIYLKVFFEYAIQNPSTIFKCSSIGCNAGEYSIDEIAPLFRDAVQIKNIHLPVEFWDILNKENI